MNKYTYGAYTDTQDGNTFDHYGTLAGAVKKAKRYAWEAFPRWEYLGYGPTVVVRDASGSEVYRKRL